MKKIWWLRFILPVKIEDENMKVLAYQSVNTSWRQDRLKQEKNRKRLIRLGSEFHNLLNCYTKNITIVKILEGLRNRINRLWFFVTEENDSCSKKISKDFADLIKVLKKEIVLNVSKF
jgi:DNA-binding FadR family transcriptional regulator